MRWLMLSLLLCPACFSVNDTADGGTDQRNDTGPPACAAGQVCNQQITAPPLRGVWAASAAEAWAVGDSGTTLHFVSGAWASVNSQVSDNLYAVWGSAANDVWVVGGSGRILHWDGTAWSNSPSPVTSYLRGVSGTSKTDVWAVGDGIFPGASGELLHWNGSNWQEMSTGLPPGTLSAVYAAPGQVWLAGDAGLLAHQQGTSWVKVNAMTAVNLKSVWGVNSNGALAGGASGALVYFDGTSARNVGGGGNGFLGLTTNPGGQGGLIAVAGPDVLQSGMPWTATNHLASASGVTLAAAATAGSNVWIAGSLGSAGYLGYITP